jgi:transposase
MRIKQTIGIDISKLTFDVRIHSNQMFRQFENTNKGFKKLIKWVNYNNSFLKEETIFIFEHTGIYSYLLSVFLTEQQLSFALVPDLEIKRSLGIARGKDDKIDATKIALYGYRLRDEIKLYNMPCKEIINLKRLLSLRERLVKQRAGFKSSLKELSRVLLKKDNNILLETQEKMIHYLTTQINKVEKSLDEIINSSNTLKKIFTLVTSVKCIGRQTALFIIAYSEAFTRFKAWRQFASYCGTAPFPNSSGTSLKGSTKVSHLANQKVKSLLDLCAKVAIQYNPEMKAFYKRRLSEGKNKMSTINIIRNKLLSRIFAVVNRKTPYVDFMKYVA